MSQGKVSSKSYVSVGSSVEMTPSAPLLVGEEPVVNALHAVPYDPSLSGVFHTVEGHPESDDEDEEGFTEYGVTPEWQDDRPIKADNIIFMPSDCGRCPIDCCCFVVASPDSTNVHGCHGHQCDGCHGHSCHGCNDCHGLHHCVEACVYCLIHGIFALEHIR